jgi:hypothetical protein
LERQTTFNIERELRHLMLINAIDPRQWTPIWKNKKIPWFVEVARTKQDPKKNSTCWLTFSQIWLIPLVDDCQSTYLTQLKKTKNKINPGT